MMTAMNKYVIYVNTIKCISKQSQRHFYLVLCFIKVHPGLSFSGGINNKSCIFNQKKDCVCFNTTSFHCNCERVICFVNHVVMLLRNLNDRLLPSNLITNQGIHDTWQVEFVRNDNNIIKFYSRQNWT